MASFTSLGVGSNLPLDTLLNNLTIAEKKRLNPITQQQSDNTARLTAYGTLKSALEKFAGIPSYATPMPPTADSDEFTTMALLPIELALAICRLCPAAIFNVPANA